MMNATHEHTLNVALGEVLGLLRRSWTTRSEQTGQVLQGGGRPDILIEEASGWPVVIEAERSNYTSAENDAKARLGRTVANTGRQIETAIALVYPLEVRSLDGPQLREAIADSRTLEYALYTRRINDLPERLPSAGWIRGGLRDLAMLVHRAAVPPPRVEALATELENGVRLAAEEFTRRHAFGSDHGAQIANVLGQSDDNEGQTRRMAMTVIVNALVFHESLAEAEFHVRDSDESPPRSVHPVDYFRKSEIFSPGDLCLEWDRILAINYWPIFWSAKQMLRTMAVPTAHATLDWLWKTGQRLVAGGVTRSNDLTGMVFQRLIADRKFLATYYTRPEAAALLAALALPADTPPGGADWGDEETLASLQIGDFACGTGTLLATAYQRLSLLHELHGGDPRKLHGPMMRHGLVGLDVLNIAVHLTAAMLAGSQPDTPFDGECLLTMPYGQQGDGSVAVGSLDLLAPNVQPSLMDSAVAVSAGGRSPEEVRDLVSRVGHAKFDLVIMNPPFTRPTNHEAASADVPIAAYAAFETTAAEQSAMSNRVKALTKDTPSSGNAGIASDFVELAHRKVRDDGTIAMVLPLSAISGSSWNATRMRWREAYGAITVVTVAGAGTHDASFSADTGMAECLLIARNRRSEESSGDPSLEKRATFVILHQQVQSAIEAELIAGEVKSLSESGELRRLEDTHGASLITLGMESLGVAVDAPLPESGPWPLVGISDVELAQTAYQLEQGTLSQVGHPNAPSIALPVTRIGSISDQGVVDRDVNGTNSDGSPRDPFELIDTVASRESTYPILWAHDAKLERKLLVLPDTEGRIKSSVDPVTHANLRDKAAGIWKTKTRAHYNRDLQFNSQSLIVAMTERPCIGGRAWPSVIFKNLEHEHAFALWCNSTLGLLLHWWTSNKTQSGRGTTTVSAIPNIPTLDVRNLDDQQLDAAKDAFEQSRQRRFLPFDQIDEDQARAELDHRLLVDVLRLPESICAPDGPVDLIRRKLAREPQIHGGKRSRVVFQETIDDSGYVDVTETTSGRSDR